MWQTKARKMTATEAYRPGMLSSLLLGEGGGNSDDASTKSSGAVTGIGGGTSKADKTRGESETLSKQGAKHSKKNMNVEGVQGALATNTSSEALGDREPQGMIADPSLSSLFSPKNLKKFKRKDRVDKAEDEAEVKHES